VTEDVARWAGLRIGLWAGPLLPIIACMLLLAGITPRLYVSLI